MLNPKLDTDQYEEIDIRRGSSWRGNHIFYWLLLPGGWIYSCWRLQTLAPLIAGLISSIISFFLVAIIYPEGNISRHFHSGVGRFVSTFTACRYISKARKKIGLKEPEEIEKLSKPKAVKQPQEK